MVLLFLVVVSVVLIVSLSMRTKSRAVPRPRGEPMLEDDVSVSASRDLHSVRCPTLEGFQQASMVVNGLDVYAHSISQRVVTGVDVVPMSDRAPSGISIREPEIGHAMVPEGLLDTLVTGKGKRKVDDVDYMRLKVLLHTLLLHFMIAPCYLRLLCIVCCLRLQVLYYGC